MSSGYVALILCIVCSIGVVQTLRLGQGFRCRSEWALAINYAVCAATSAGWWALKPGFSCGRSELAYGLPVGVAVVAGLYVITSGVRIIGAGITQTFERLAAVLLPTLAAMMFWDGRPDIIKLAGLSMALASFILIGQGETNKRQGGTRWINLAMLVAGLIIFSGVTGIGLKAYTENAGVESNPVFLFIILVTAMVISLFPAVLKGRRPTGVDGSIGLLLGILNMASLATYYAAIARLDGVIVFPSLAAGIIVGGTLVSALFWKERYNRWAVAGISAAVMALMLINWPTR